MKRNQFTEYNDFILIIVIGMALEVSPQKKVTLVIP